VGSDQSTPEAYAWTARLELQHTVDWALLWDLGLSRGGRQGGVRQLNPTACALAVRHELRHTVDWALLRDLELWRLGKRLASLQSNCGWGLGFRAPKR
jgi:hypothetical protein